MWVRASRWLALLGASLALACAAAPPAPVALVPAEEPAGVVFLVRHGETEGNGSDPALSEQGHARAARLAARLSSEAIERVLTTDYARTRETASPLAAALGIDVEIYDPRSLAALAESLRRDGGRVVVVGHSNTTPELVSRLGGQPGDPIAEDEHDRIYRVELPSGKTRLARY
jgi:broad specificity phosphatase PhoE